MSEEIKFIVSELNNPPYNRNYNLITFDNLSPEQLLQVLNDVFAEIDSKNRHDIREEEPEQMAVRMLGMLRILKYRPPDETMNIFREGLVNGEKEVIRPILSWMLRNLQELKKRAYLAKYLVKIDLPSEIRGDPEVADVFAQYETLIEHFKDVHRECEGLRSSGYSTTELRKDIAAMEEEKELVSRRIERMKTKVEATPNYEQMLMSAKALRQEKERQSELAQQEAELHSQVQAFDKRATRLEKQLGDIRKAGIGSTPEGVVQRLEEDVKVTSFIVKENLPKELASKKRKVEILQSFADRPAMNHEDIDSINRGITKAEKSLKDLTDLRRNELEREESLESKIGKLSFFRQNAQAVRKKKELTLVRLSELRNEINSLAEELKEKQEQLQQYSGQEVLKGEEFKMYVNKLKNKSSTYKMKRTELNELRAEYGVLSRTKEILESQDHQIEEQLGTLEKQMGVSGFRETYHNLEMVSTIKAEVDERKGKTLEEMSDMVTKLNQKINERKSSLAPIIKELRPLRQKYNDLSVYHGDKKATYDSVAAGLESNIAKLEQDVKSLREEILKSESTCYIRLAEKEAAAHWLQEVGDEIKLYLSHDPQSKKKSLRDQLTQLITEQEKQGKILREDQKMAKELSQSSAKQLAMWQDVIRLMATKKKCLNASMGKNGNPVNRRSGSESMVL